MLATEPKVMPDSDFYFYYPSVTATKLYFYTNIIGRFHYEAGYCIQRSQYDSFLLMLPTSGSGYIKQGEHTFSFKTGQIAFLDCYSPHEYGYDTSSEVLWIHFDGPLARTYYESITGTHGNVITLENPQFIVLGLKNILRTFRNSQPVKEAEVSETITRILNTILNTRSASSNTLSHVKIVEKSVAYINEHFEEPLSLEVLALKSNMSPYHFTRVFSRETGYTPHQYLIATRLLSAKFLLQFPDIPIKEICFRSGFNSESSFCTTFKKWEHLTPQKYRDAIIKGAII